MFYIHCQIKLFCLWMSQIFPFLIVKFQERNYFEPFFVLIPFNSGGIMWVATTIWPWSALNSFDVNWVQTNIQQQKQKINIYYSARTPMNKNWLFSVDWWIFKNRKSQHFFVWKPFIGSCEFPQKKLG